MKAQVQWMTASPLWGSLLKNGQADTLKQAALLRFASDNFMEDMDTCLKKEPGKLVDFIAQPESFQARPLGEPLTWKSPPPPQLKLYQPSHGHFYLVACSLVCRMPGFPDHKVDKAQGERVSFVLRRVVPAQGTTPLRYDEYAWVVKDQASGWQKTASPETVLENEERLPLFNMSFTEENRTRRLWVGYIPVSSGETFRAAPELTPIAPLDSEGDPRPAELETRVINPLKELTESNADNQEAQRVSLFILLDLADFLQLSLPDVWAAVLAGSWPGPAGDKKNLFDQLGVWTVDGITTWRKALLDVWQQRDNINASGEAKNPLLTYNLRNSPVPGNEIKNYVETALGSFEPPSAPPAEVRAPKVDPIAGDSYALRCVYEQPRCGPFQPPVVSEPSRLFQLAPFFDPDAPARPIQIPLPVDTSIAGLRKFNKNVTFIISDKLKNQINRISKDTIKEGTVGPEGSFALGSICSFSISIIFICAFVLLLVILIVLNIVFWWLPFFKICFPIPMKK